MKIITIIPDVDPAQAAELMQIVEEALLAGAGWQRGRDYSLGVYDDACRPLEVE